MALRAGDAAWAVPLSDVLVDDEIEDGGDRSRPVGLVEHGAAGRRARARVRAASAVRRHALAVANGTAALHLALLAVGCGAG